MVFVPPYRVANVSVTSPEPSVMTKERCAFFWALAVELVLSLLMTMRAKTMARASGSPTAFPLTLASLQTQAGPDGSSREDHLARAEKPW